MADDKGMTLVELLVVVGVVGMLAGLVVVSINPRAHMNAAAEARAKGSVARVASAVVACISANNGSEALCNTWAKLYNGGFVQLANQPAGVVVGTGCVSMEEAVSQFCKYQTITEKVDCNQATACTP